MVDTVLRWKGHSR